MLRRDFEDILRATARAGLVDIVDASWEKDGKRIEFRKVTLPRRAGKTELQRKSGYPSRAKFPVPPLPLPADARRSRHVLASEEGSGRRWFRACAASHSSRTSTPRHFAYGESRKRKNNPSLHSVSLQIVFSTRSQRNSPGILRNCSKFRGWGRSLSEKYGAAIFQVLSH